MLIAIATPDPDPQQPPHRPGPGDLYASRGDVLALVLSVPADGSPVRVEDMGTGLQRCVPARVLATWRLIAPARPDVSGRWDVSR